jgi:hypothetical protein
MPILGTVGSSYYVPPVYALAATYESNGTFTVPAGKTQIALVGVSAGGGGRNYEFFGAAGGGASGVAFILKEIPTSAGTSYNVTIGAGGAAASAGGSLTFGSVLTATGGGAGPAYGGSSPGGTASNTAGTLETTSRSQGRGLYEALPPNSSVSSADPALGSYNAGGGGGAGGLGGRWPQNDEERFEAHPPNNTWCPAASGGGNGGGGGTSTGANQGTLGGAGASATIPGGGGGGAGHGGYGPNAFNPNPGASVSGGQGFRGQLFIYVR